MSEKRFLLSINVRWWNAEAAYAVNLARGLLAKGYPVWMIVNHDSPVQKKAQKHGIPVVTDIKLDAMSPLAHFFNLRKILRLIDTHDIQLINSFKSNGSFLFSLARRLRPHLTYIKTRGEARAPGKHFANRFLYGAGACDGIIAVGSPVKLWLQDLGLIGQRLAVVHYGESSVTRSSDQERDSVRRELNIPAAAKVLTLLGRTQRVKGHDLLLAALAHFKKEPFHLVFLVKDLDEFPEELQILQRFMTENKMQQQVTILGFQKDLGRILSLTDLGVIPSLDSEVNCRVAVEFFSLGIPVLAFPTGTLPDIVRHKENGYLTAEKNEKALVQGIQWMTTGAERLQHTGAEARNSYLDHYTLEKMTEETLLFYEQCGG
ncbi:MAG: glycosyltransferase family 4 protein [Deltaproteobacteria bacterium]|jgi:glycosyltransferase involved in cell wall biosynthesis|nr:glycosyltransferase family 4 protein [Deltaproteobacteria bacterium]MBT4263204.1 glycosyltransferase family 4 protein [Deltaproteobacteria bacterium]MBT4640952.1 glycosyltransferase family 4 protein [Deltaproteobacteria bacterium]MBT6501829.1 glycosyltransferase family 4 protein [Deltaproteobacteria bacterium]MBT7711205.1 glycosyltransferase family 4 protein [Deltaproteobacteria bacterium]